MTSAVEQSVIELSAQLEQLQVRLFLEGDELRVRAPKGVITPQLASQIKASKQDLIQLLKKPQLTIQPRRTKEPVPLSFAQQRLWFLDRLDTKSGAYNMVIALGLEGNLKIAALNDAFNLVIQRHENLRTRFPMIEGRPVQEIQDYLPVLIKTLDASANLENLLQQETHFAFDLENGPLLRLFLHSTAAENHVLVLNMHHIIADAWSSRVLLEEIGQAYAALAEGQTPKPEDLPIQYADFALWQRAQFQANAWQKHMQYWRNRLGGAPPLLELPYDRPRPETQTFRGATHVISLKNLVRTSGVGGVSPFLQLQTAFVALLNRYGSGNDLVYGTPTANRDLLELEPLTGLFTNTVALRAQIGEMASWSELLDHVRELNLDAQAAQAVPFEQVVNLLQPERDLGYAPIFQVLITYINADIRLQLGDLRVTHLDPPADYAKFDLSLTLTEYPHKTLAAFEYNTDLFDAATIHQMANLYDRLVTAMCKHPHIPFRQVNVLDPQQHKILLQQWRQPAGLSPFQSVPQYLNTAAATHPQRQAVTTTAGTFSYSELNNRSNQIAANLLKQGIQPEDRVAVCLNRNLALPTALLAVLKAGAAYVPIDPKLPTQRIHHILEDSGAVLVLTERSLAPSIPQSNARLLFVEDTPQTAVAEHQIVLPPQSLAYIIYTSGSTGKPKGVGVSHGALSNFLTAMAASPGMGADDALMAVTTVSFDIAALELFLPLISGARLILPDTEALADNPLKTIADTQATIVQATPAFWRACLESGQSWPDQLKLLCGGEGLPRDLAERLQSKGAAIWNMYGPTETTVWSAVKKLDHTFQTPYAPIGPPIQATDILVLDQELNPVPAGVPGQLFIGGSGLARGYHNQPGRTASFFLPHPFSDQAGARLYQTGDRVRFITREGCTDQIQFLGRVDFQIKLRGFRIEPGEIETCLQKLPHISAAVVVITKTNPSLAAWLIAENPHSPPDKAQITSQLALTLPHYMVPDRLVFVEEYPQNSSGKIDRAQLAARHTHSDKAQFRAPATPTQQTLTRIWSDTLEVASIGIDDNFFQLGGDSIRSITIAVKAREAGLQLSVRDLFRNPTIARLSDQLDHTQSTPAPTQQPQHTDSGQEIQETYPLSPIQEGMLFHHAYEADTGVYAVQISRALQPNLNVDAFRQAWRLILTRHPMLRTSFTGWHNNQQPRQQVHAQPKAQFLVLDWCNLSPQVTAKKLDNLLQQDLTTPFDMTQPPLRFHLIQTADTQRFIWTFHHILLDGWSMAVIFKEVLAAYQALDQGKAPKLPPAPVYRTHIDTLQAKGLSRAEPFWRQHLAGIQAPTPLPEAAPVNSQQPAAWLQTETHLSAQLTQQLTQLARSNHVTLNTLLQGIWALVLSRCSGQSSVLFGEVDSGRDPAIPNIESMVGLLVNTLPVKVDLPAGLAPGPWLQTLFHNQLERKEYAHTPLVKIKTWSEISGAQSLFQSLFVFENYPVDRMVAEIGQSLDINDQIPTSSDLTSYPLNLFIAVDTTLHLRISHDTHIIAPDTAQRLLSYIQTLALDLTTQPQRCLAQLKMLNDTQRRRILNLWNQTNQPPPQTQTIHQFVRRQQDPATTAIIDNSGSWTYAQLFKTADSLTQELLAQGIGPETPVGIFTRRSRHMIAAMLAVLQAGGAYVPLDPAYPQARITHIINDTQLRHLLTDAAVRSRLPANQAVLIDVERTDAISDVPAPQVLPLQTAYLIHTSGSTGKPKGVAISHAAATEFLNWSLKTFDEPMGVAVSTSICFDLSIFEIFGTLAAGGKLIVMDNILHLRDHAALDQINLINTVPSALSELLRRDHLPSTVRVVNLAGEPFNRDLIRRIYAQPGVNHLYNLYGPSEDTTYSTQGRIDADDTVHIGKPLHNTRAYLLDQHLQPVPQGAPGALYLAGKQMARGYGQRPDLTALRFIPNPFSDQPSRLYATGDLVRYRANGDLDFLGRVDDQVKIRGFRIEPGEIEAHLLAHDDIEECLVMGRETRPGEVNLTAYAAITQARRDRDDTAAREQLALWQKVWDDTYHTDPQAENPAFDLSGWKDSHTGDDIPADQMREWLEDTVTRILALRPQRVLEIGCGSGLILFRVAPHTQEYAGFDISPHAVQRVARHLPAHNLEQIVTLKPGSAHDWSQDTPLDLIIINSVAQYFPDIHYFINVLKHAVDHLQTGGRIFLGDLRHQGLQDLFQTAVKVAGAEDHTPAGNLKRHIQEAVEAESELTFNPLLFHHLKTWIPRLSDMKIHVKPGSAHNELTCYRYDVILQVDTPVQRPTLPSRQWPADWTLDHLDQELQAGHTPILHGIPNARTTQVQALAHACALESNQHQTLAELQSQMKPQTGVQPHALYQLARKHHRQLLLTWDPADTHHLCAAFYQNTPPQIAVPVTHQALEHYANDPLHGKLVAKLIPQLRRHLEGRLPRHMTPTDYVILKQLPRLANGKINRAALPQPRTLQAAAPAHTADNSTEKAIAAIWCELLQLNDVDTQTNFFDQGGHSLLLARMQGMLKEQLDVELNMVDLFRFPNIQALARHINREAPQAPPQEQAALPRVAQDDIAVIGFAARVPGAADAETFWQNLCNGVESIQFHSRDQARNLGVPQQLFENPNYVGAAAKLDDIDRFDAAFFDINPAEAKSMDPQHRLFLELSWHALEHAGWDPNRIPGEVGIFAGAGLSVYLLQNPGIIDSVGPFQALIANDKDYVPTRVAYKLNLTGPAVNVQTACSTSLTATHMACRSLMDGECDLALAGGVTISGREPAGYIFQEGSLYSKDGRCRAFDAQSSGVVFGDGLGMVVLKRLRDAQQDHDHIHFLIKSTAVNNDGSDRMGFTAPGVRGQQKVVERALQQAQINPETIGYVETHGTGTSLGDPIEVNALTNAWRSQTMRTAFCPLGSVKSNLGHLGFAAGVIGLLKAGLALERELIPASLHCASPNPKCDFDKSPFFVNTQSKPWPRTTQPRRAAVSSFGLGGANAHAVLEEAPLAPPATPHARRGVLLMLSAKTQAALKTMRQQLADHLEANPQQDLADTAHTLQLGRARFTHRQMVYARDHAEATRILRNPSTAAHQAQAAKTVDVAFMFPGGGVQYPNMGRDLYQNEPIYARYVDQCADLLQPKLGYDFRQLLYPEANRDTSAELRRIEANLVTIFATSYAAAKLWQVWGITPKMMIGHSLGEYVAACLAGVFSLEDALDLVLQRARLFNRLPKGAMLSVAEAPQRIQNYLTPGLSIAIINGPKELIVSGDPNQIKDLATALERGQISTRRLHIDVAAHSPLLEPILDEFRDYVAGFELKPPTLPFISNLTGKPITHEEATDPNYWRRHLRRTVRFSDGLACLLQHTHHILEVGPGRSLVTAAASHPAKQDSHHLLTSMRHPKEDIADDRFLLTTLGRLWTLGCEVDWAAFYGSETRRRAVLPGYPFQRKRFWTDAPQPQHQANTRLSAGFAWTQAPQPPQVENAGPIGLQLSDQLNQQLLQSLPAAPEDEKACVVFDGTPPPSIRGTHLIRLAGPQDLDAQAWFQEDSESLTKTLIEIPNPNPGRARRKLATQLAREILAPASSRRVSLLGNQRRIWSAHALPKPAPIPPFNHNATYLIIGEPGPAFAELPKALADTYQATLHQIEAHQLCPPAQHLTGPSLTKFDGVLVFGQPQTLQNLVQDNPDWDPKFIVLLTPSKDQSQSAYLTAQMQQTAVDLAVREALPITALTWNADHFAARRLTEFAAKLNTGFAVVTHTPNQETPDELELETEPDQVKSPPQGQTEIMLAQIWSQALGIATIGRDDNFFELGGHSLLATRILAKIHDQTQIKLPLAKLFKAPTIQSLALVIAEHQPTVTVEAPIMPAADQTPAPLSYAQQRQWFFFKFEGDPGTWRAMVAIDIEGELDMALLEQCLSQLSDRHHILRTLYHEVDGRPVQKLLPPQPVSIQLDEFTGDDPQIDVWVRDQGRRPFDLAQDPPLRVSLLKQSPLKHTMAVIMHHIASDAWSINIFISELAELYTAARQNRAVQLKPLPIQYSDFAVWQNRQFSQPQHQERLLWWRDHLMGAPALLELPTQPRPPIQSANGDTLAVTLPPQLKSLCDQICSSAAVSPFMLMHAGLAMLLARYTDVADIPIGTPVADRPRPELEGLIGFFVNTLVPRVKPTPNLTFSQYLNHVKTVDLAAFNHADVPFEQVVEQLQPKRNLAYSPLFQVMFAFQNAPAKDTDVAGLKFHPRHVNRKAAMFDLTLFLGEHQGQIGGHWEYNTDLFPPQTIARMSRHFQTLLEAALTTPDLPLCQLNLMSKQERQTQLVEWNQTARTYPTDLCVHQLIQNTAARRPDAIAVMAEQSLTYAQLDDAANRLAHRLIQLGVTPETPVGLISNRSHHLIIGLLAILKSGGNYVPMDPSLPFARLDYMRRDSGMKILLTQGIQAPDNVTVQPLDADLADMPTTAPEIAITAQHAAYQIYTSGSTGKPKAVLMPHRPLVNLLTAMLEEPGFSQEDRLLAVVSISFDIAVMDWLLPLVAGGVLVPATREQIIDPKLLAARILDAKITVLHATPATWRELKPYGPFPGLRMHSAGENLLADLADPLLKHGNQLWNIYGPTEACIYSAGNQILSTTGTGATPIGGPLANTRLYILNPQGQPQPIGLPGELCIAGDCLARGYQGRADLTADRFVPDPFGEGRLYRTGDRARYLSNGKVEILGRLDHQIKLRGFRIELGELETTLSRMPEINQAVAGVHADHLTAWLLPDQPIIPDESKLRQQLQAQLPQYMIPDQFVWLTSFPLNSNGKVDRNALLNHRPQNSQAGPLQQPQGPTQTKLLSIWREILNHDNVGINDNFFESGGNSLLLIRVRAQIETQLGRDLPMTQLFQYPTISDLAAFIDKPQAAAIDLSAMRKRENRKRRRGRPQ